MTERRRFILAAAALPLTLPLAAHTPYRQWVIYRKQHLLIGCHRQDEAAYPRAKAMQAVLETTLPEAQARVARAPDVARLASLFATGQLELGLLRASEAAGVREGSGTFAPYGPVAIEAVASFGPHVLYATPGFPSDHLVLLLDAFETAQQELGFAVPDDDAGAWNPDAAHWFDHHRS